MSLLRTERGLDRLVNFSDAAVAIAITLLILPSVDFAGEIAHSTLSQVLADHWVTLLSFLISFAVIGNLWLAHHALFELIRDYDHGLAWLNLLWLLSIVVLPFSTGILAHAPSGERSVYGLYIGNIVVADGTTLLMRLLLRQHSELLRPEVADRLNLGNEALQTLSLVVALVLSVSIPGVGAYSLLLLLFTSRAEHLIARLRARRGK